MAMTQRSSILNEVEEFTAQYLISVEREELIQPFKTLSVTTERGERCVWGGAGVSESLGVNVWTLCVCTLKLHLEIYMIKTCIFLHIKQDIKPQNAEKLHIDTSLTLNSDSGCNF